MPEMMSPRDLARRCGVALGTVYWWTATGQVPHVRLGPRCVRFRPEEIDLWLESKRVAPRVSAPNAAGPR